MERDELHCTHCGKTRHTKEYCLDLVGQPQKFNTALLTAESSNDRINYEKTAKHMGELNC